MGQSTIAFKLGLCVEINNKMHHLSKELFNRTKGSFVRKGDSAKKRRNRKTREVEKDILIPKISFNSKSHATITLIFLPEQKLINK